MTSVIKTSEDGVLNHHSPDPWLCWTGWSAHIEPDFCECWVEDNWIPDSTAIRFLHVSARSGAPKIVPNRPHNQRRTVYSISCHFRNHQSINGVLRCLLMGSCHRRMVHCHVRGTKKKEQLYRARLKIIVQQLPNVSHSKSCHLADKNRWRVYSIFLPYWRPTPHLR